MTCANPDRVGKIRVLLVGSSGSGKTSLAHYLAYGKPLHAPKLTVGCNVFLKLVDYHLEEAGSGASTTRQCFVELWDVGAHERYRSMRSLFFSNINGVLLLHDLSQARSLTSLPKWADFVTQNATFSAPLADEQAAGNLGALPVPYLIVGNKADLAGSSTGLHRLPWRAAVARFLERFWERLPWRNAWPALTRQLSRTASTMVPDAELLDASISTSALTGTVDYAAIDTFFTDCILRRYHAASLTQRPRQPAPTGAAITGAAMRVSASSSRTPQSPFSTLPSATRPHSMPAAGRGATADWEVRGQRQQSGLNNSDRDETGRIDDEDI